MGRHPRPYSEHCSMILFSITSGMPAAAQSMAWRRQRVWNGVRWGSVPFSDMVCGAKHVDVQSHLSTPPHCLSQGPNPVLVRLLPQAGSCAAPPRLHPALALVPPHLTWIWPWPHAVPPRIHPAAVWIRSWHWRSPAPRRSGPGPARHLAPDQSWCGSNGSIN